MSVRMNATQWLASNNSFNSREEILNSFTRAKTICFLSGKGGVGKTTCSLKFAQDLAISGQKVLLIDCDFNLSNTGVKLSIVHDRNLVDISEGESNYQDYIYTDWDCDLLFAGNGSLKYFDRSESDYLEIVLNAIQKLERSYDTIVLDLPAGCSKTTLSLSSYCDQRIIVVTPDRSSLTDSYSVIKLLNKIYGVSKNEILINKIQNNRQAAKVSNSLIETATRFLAVDIKLLGLMPFVEASFEKIDRTIFDRKNSPLQENMQKIIKCYSEEVGASQLFSIGTGVLNAATGCQPTSQGV